MQTPDNQNTIVTFAVLTGLTPLIPVPFVDDLARSYFKRHMVRRLATSHGAGLGDREVGELIDDVSSGGCFGGCLGAAVSYPLKAVLYPLKRIFRKIFFFLEWKRAADTVSRTYYQGFMIDQAIAEGWLGRGGKRTPAEVRSAIDRILERTDTRPIERTVASTFRGFKGLIRDAASLIGREVPARAVGGDRVEQAVVQAEQREGDRLSSVIEQVGKSITAMPAEHFASLRKGLADELA